MPWCSLFPTPASAFPPPTSRASSSASIEWTRPAPAKLAALASAWQSPSISLKCTADGYGSRAKSASALGSIFPSHCSIQSAPQPARLPPGPEAAQSVPIPPQTLSALLFAYSSPSYIPVMFMTQNHGSVQSCAAHNLPRRFRMAAAAGLTEAVLYDTLVNYLISMARVVESAMNSALDAIIAFDNPRTSALPAEVFLLEPRINEMEIIIDEHAILLLPRGSFPHHQMLP